MKNERQTNTQCTCPCFDWCTCRHQSRRYCCCFRWPQPARACSLGRVRTGVVRKAMITARRRPRTTINQVLGCGANSFKPEPRLTTSTIPGILLSGKRCRTKSSAQCYRMRTCNEGSQARAANSTGWHVAPQSLSGSHSSLGPSSPLAAWVSPEQPLRRTAALPLCRSATLSLCRSAAPCEV